MYPNLFYEQFKKIKNSLISFVSSRLFPVQVLVIVFGAILVYRMFYLQIMNGDVYYEKYMNQTVQTVSIPATRGTIYDCNGIALTENKITYSVTIKDLEVYTGKGELNSMIYRLVQILNKYNAEIISNIPVIVNTDGMYEFSGREAKIRQLIRDVYSTETITKLQEKGEDPYSYDAETVITYMAEKIYKFKNLTGKNGLANYKEISKEDALKMMSIRYAMSANSYRKYLSTVVSENISDEVRSAILENQEEIQGVEIEEGVTRVYPYAEYFSHVLGYTGVASENELEILRKIDETYEFGDVVGKTDSGIEYVMEQELSGTKGSYTIYKDSRGVVLDIVDVVEPVAGNDVYLSLDAMLTVAIYKILEETLASALYEHIILEDFIPTTNTITFDICVRDVYFQMIYNNILDYEAFADEEASEIEKIIYEKYSSYYNGIKAAILEELYSDNPSTMEQLSEEMQGYLKAVATLLNTNGVIISDNIDTTNEVYVGWKEGTVTLKDYLTLCIENQWIDIEKLGLEEQYSSSAQVQKLLIAYIEQTLGDNSDFVKLLYDYLIHSKIITGNEVCIALMEQGILEYNPDDVELLMGGDEQVAMDYIKMKIYYLEITPAMIALDPFSGSVVVTDVKTGKIKAIVSYPGYDLNKLSGSVDAEYYNKLRNDQSFPMYNRATQTRLSPGSTYKMLSGIAGVMEGVIGIDEYVTCNGIFEFTNQMCWIFREQGGTHGPMNLRTGLANSCNEYFFEVGYRLSINEDGEYDEKLGLERLKKYADMFGFNSKTGIEIVENVSQTSDEYPISSAIGQGTNNFTVVQMNRYMTAIASRGNVYQYTLLDKVTDYEGNILKEMSPEVISTVDLPNELWDAIWEGMEMVLSEGSVAGSFNDIDLNVVGKTGTAQENLLRANHSNFISFAPAEDPEISVEVFMPNCGKSTYPIAATKLIYKYYYELENYDKIVDGKANTTVKSATIAYE